MMVTTAVDSDADTQWIISQVILANRINFVQQRFTQSLLRNCVVTEHVHTYNTKDLCGKWGMCLFTHINILWA